jgi:hypothetical protein
MKVTITIEAEGRTVTVTEAADDTDAAVGVLMTALEVATRQPSAPPVAKPKHHNVDPPAGSFP